MKRYRQERPIQTREHGGRSIGGCIRQVKCSCSAFVVWIAFPWCNTKGWHVWSQVEVQYGLGSEWKFLFRHRSYPKQRMLSCNDYDKLVITTRRAKEVLRYHQGLSTGYRNCSFGLAKALPKYDLMRPFYRII